MRRPRHWRFWLPLVMLLVLVSGLVAVLPGAAANNGIPVSNGASNNNRPALAVSPDGTKACVAWALFDVNQDAYVRVYDRPTNTWTPPLTAPALNVSQSPGEGSSTARCTFDGAGTLHVVWLEGSNQNGSSRVQHRLLAAGRDPGQLANWSPIATVSTESDEQWPDVAAQFSDPAGRLWLTYTVASGSGFTILARSWTPQGWSGATQVASADGQYSRVAVDDAGSVHVIYGSRGGERYTARDVTSGAWSPDVQVPGADKPLAQTGIAVNRTTGDVHIVYTLLYADANRVVNYVRKNGATGAAFTGPVTIAAGDRFNVSRIAAAPNGRLTMVTDGAGGGSALAFATSADNGTTWSSPTVFTDGSVKAQWPWVAEDATGNAYVAYWNGNGNTIQFVVPDGSGAPLPPAPPPPPAPATATATVKPSPTATPSPTPKPPPNHALPVPPINDGKHDYFTQTGHNLGGAFREYWHTQGGLTRFGFPLTEEFTEQSPDDGKTYIVQYFERARFEWHPENPSPYNILLSRLGILLRPIDAPAAPQPGASYFTQTGHNLEGTFLAYWQANGGLAVFGLPTSEVFIETSKTDGKQYRVQYFERNRFELHPEYAGTQYEVLLGLLGRQQLVDRGWLR